MPTLVDILETYLTRPDVVERMQPSQSACDTLRAFGVFFAQVGAAILRVAESPRSPGYEPWLIEHGSNPIAARGPAALAVRSGTRRAKEDERRREVIDAIRFLVKPGRSGKVIVRKAKFLLEAWEETSIIETIFDHAGLDVFEFIRSLKSIAEGHKIASHRLTEIAASLSPHLSIARGRKIAAASLAHEYFLESMVTPMERRRAYTWNYVEGDFTDRATEATRLEFGCPDFDPRPACRRMKTRQAN
jgi:hypothetical protein